LAEGARLVNNAKFLIQICKGLIRQQSTRRHLMFYSVLVAMLMLFAGATFLWPLLRDHPLVFLGWWAACGWITLLAMLLALYDLVQVRAEGQRLRRELARRILEKKADDENPR
jgi:hypothetical protein